MSILIRRYGDTDFVTGLRCIAAVMVIMIHTAGLRDFGTLGNIITDNGKYGVQIFFVISGFTIARTYGASPGFGPYFGRRLMRIAPLYYVLIVLAFALIVAGAIPVPYWMAKYDSAPDAYNLGMHLVFLSSWDVRIAASLLGVEWTIPIEIFWYAVLPALLPISRDRRRLMMIFAALLVLSVSMKAVEYLALPGHAAHFLPLSYGAYFYLGALSERLRRDQAGRSRAQRLKYTYAFGGLFVIGLLSDTGLNAGFLGVATAGLIVFHPGRAAGQKGGRGFLCLPPVLFLGSISYSLYLIHPLAIELVNALPPLSGHRGLAHFAIVTGVTVAFSALTYSVIEYPSNQLGKRLFGARAVKPAP